MDSVKVCEEYYKDLNYQSVAYQNRVPINQANFLFDLITDFASKPKNVPGENIQKAMKSISDLLAYGSPEEDTANLYYKSEMGEVLKSPLGLQVQSMQNIQMAPIVTEEHIKTR